MNHVTPSCRGPAETIKEASTDQSLSIPHSESNGHKWQTLQVLRGLRDSCRVLAENRGGFDMSTEYPVEVSGAIEKKLQSLKGSRSDGLREVGVSDKARTEKRM